MFNPQVSLITLSAVAGLTLVASPATAQETSPIVGGVYAMSNDFAGNTVVAYARRDNGMIEMLGEYATGGLGAAFDGGEGLDPLISAYALTITDDNQFILATNAGSNTISAFVVNPDMTLTLTSTVGTGGVGPNSITHREGLVYVSNIDADGVFTGEPDQEGSIMGFRLSDTGELTRIPGSRRVLRSRPSAVELSPDGRFLVIASINAGSVRLPRAIGEGRARQMSFTGNFIDAATALNWGLVNEVVPHDELMERAGQLALDVASMPAAALTRYRQLYDENADLDSALLREQEVSASFAFDREALANNRESIVSRGRDQAGG